MHDRHKNEDEITWKAFQAGDQQAFSALYERYYDDLFAYGFKLSGGNRAVVLDTIQNLFVKLWSRKELLAVPHSIKYYLIKAFRRHLLKEMEGISSCEISKKEENSLIQHSFEDEIIREQTLDEQSHHLAKSLATLPQRQQEIIYLKFYASFSYEEIAEVLSLNIHTVYNQVSRAVDRMRKSDLVYKVDLLVIPLLLAILFV